MLRLSCIELPLSLTVYEQWSQQQTLLMPMIMAVLGVCWEYRSLSPQGCKEVTSVEGSGFFFWGGGGGGGFRVLGFRAVGSQGEWFRAWGDAGFRRLEVPCLLQTPAAPKQRGLDEVLHSSGGHHAKFHPKP